jgi:hypothetical protein
MATGETRYGHGDVLAVPGIRKDGSGVSPEFTIVPVRDEASQLIGMVAIMRDVTARFEEMNALRQKIAAANKPPAERIPGRCEKCPSFLHNRTFNTGDRLVRQPAGEESSRASCSQFAQSLVRGRHK